MNSRLQQLLLSLGCVLLVVLVPGCGNRCHKKSTEEKVERVRDKKHSRTQVYEPKHEKKGHHMKKTDKNMKKDAPLEEVVLVEDVDMKN